MQFFYHPDHLGSSNYITDVSGEVYQHLEYFTSGETFVEQRKNTEYTTYYFSGKELDTETGLYYFEARYYDPRVGIFLTVDPLIDKYPGVSGYAYCMNNPVKLIDPDGRRIVDSNGNVIYTHKGGWAANAPDDAVRLGNAMMGTWKGKTRFNAMVNANYPITLSISSEDRTTTLENGSIRYHLGEAKKNVNSSDKTITSVSITVFEGTMANFLQNGRNSLANEYRESTKTIEQALGAVGCHEGFHSTDQTNIMHSIENSTNNTSHDIERGPREEERQVLREQFNNNMEPKNIRDFLNF